MNPIKKKTPTILGTLLVLALLAGFLVPTVPVSAGSGYSPITVWLGTNSVTVSADDYNNLFATYNTTISGTYGTHTYTYNGVPIYRILEFAFPAISSLSGYNVLSADAGDYKVVYGPNLMDNTPVKDNNKLIIATSGNEDGTPSTKLPRTACETSTAGNRFNNNIATLKLQYTIQAPAPANGTIVPASGWISGSNNPWTNSVTPALSSDYNANQTFNLVPSSGYYLSTLNIDGSAHLPAYSYTFNEVTANHTIAATFETYPAWALPIKMDNSTFNLTQAEFEGMPQNTITVTTMHGTHTWSGVPLWKLAAKNDGDGDSAAFNETLASYNYSIKAASTVSDGKAYIRCVGPTSSNNAIAHNDDIILANKMDGYTISPDEGPLKVVGVGLISSRFVSQIASLELVYTINITTSDHGSIIPVSNEADRDGVVGVTMGSDQTMALTPAAGYHVESITTDTGTQPAATSYTFSDVQANHSITAAFALVPNFSISVSAGSNGTITPAGTAGVVTVSEGASQTFTIAANENYYIANVIVDGVSQGPLTSYPFTNIASNHTISASFAANFTLKIINGASSYNLTQTQYQAMPQVTKTITTTNSVGVSSTDTYTGVSLYKLIALNDGDSDPATFNLTLAATNYSIRGTDSTGYNQSLGQGYGITIANNENLLVVNLKNGQSFSGTKYSPLEIAGLVSMDSGAVSISTSKMVYNLSSLEIVYIVKMTQGSHGTITQAGSSKIGDGNVPVSIGANQTFTITPAAGYQVDSITTDAGIQPAATSYTFNNVTGNHTITASFITKYAINVSSGEHGSATANPVAVNKGESSSVTVAPEAGYELARITDNGNDVTGLVQANVYTITNITADHAIVITFALIPVVKVSVLPVIKTVNSGATFNLTLNIDTNYETRGWQADINFDAAKLQALLVSEGGFLKDWASAHGDSTAQAVAPVIDNAGGHITGINYAIVGTANLNGPSGTGVLCTITFKAKDNVNGSSPVTPSNVFVGDIYGAALHDITIAGSTVGMGTHGTATSVTLKSNKKTAPMGQEVVFTATVSKTGTGKPTGTVTFFEGETALGEASVNSSSAAIFIINTLNIGAHSITAVYSGDSAFSYSSTASALVQTITKGVPQVKAVAYPVSPVYGQPLVFNASFSLVSPLILPTGTIQFTLDKVALGGPVTLVNGAATSPQAPVLSAGAHKIRVSYSGDSNYAAFTGKDIAFSVLQSDSTATVVSSTASSLYGDTITFTATVIAVSPGAGIPSAKVTLKEGKKNLASGSLNGAGQATWNITGLLPGSHAITVVYLADKNFKGSTSGEISVTVNKKTPSVNLTSLAGDTVDLGQNVTLTATVSGVKPTGKVQFYDGQTALGKAVTLASGKATLKTNKLPAGTHSIVAEYKGDTKYQDNNSQILSLTVGRFPPRVTFTATPKSPVAGQQLTLKLTITGKSGFIPTGTVTFMDGNTVLGTPVAVTKGSAVYSTNTLAAGSHTLQAVYSGDTNYLTVTASPITLTVK
jgi:hypothetical protein